MKKVITSFLCLVFCFVLSSCFLTVQEKDFYFGENYVITLDNTFFSRNPQQELVEGNYVTIYSFGGNSAGINITENDDLDKIEEKFDDTITILDKGMLNIGEKYLAFIETISDEEVYIYVYITKFSGDIIYKAYTYYDDDYKDIYNNKFMQWYLSINKVL